MEARAALFGTCMIDALFPDAGTATVPGPCPRILTLGYVPRASVRNLGPEPSESAFTACGAASVRKLGVGSGGIAECAAGAALWSASRAGGAHVGRRHGLALSVCEARDQLLNTAGGRDYLSRTVSVKCEPKERSQAGNTPRFRP
jgi:hypothetical protein